MLKKIFKIFLLLFIGVILLITSVLTVIQVPSVQSEIVQEYILPKVNNMFGTEIDVEEVDITFFGDVSLKSITALDEKDSLLISIKEIQASPDYFKLINGSPYELDEVSLYEPKVYVKKYKGSDKDNFLKFIDLFKSDSENIDSTKLVIEGDINIYNGYIEIINENLSKDEEVWVKASDLNLEIDNFRLDDSDVYAKIKSLTFKAQRNKKQKSEMMKFSGDFTYKNDLLQIKDIALQTSNSKLEGQFAFVYNDASDDFSDFYNKIKWKVDLDRGSYLGMKDIQYFVPYWDKHTKLKVEGKIRGTLSNLELQNVELSALKTKIRGEKIYLHEIYDSKRFNINAKDAYITSSYNDLIKFLPKRINQNIPVLVKEYGQINLKGSLRLDKNNINTKSHIQSSTLGDLITDINIQNYMDKSISYNGKINAINFDLNKLTGVKELGTITANLNVFGKGYDLKTMNVEAKGVVSDIDIMDKHLSNININGSIYKEVFSGLVDIDDPNIALNFDGSIDFSSNNYDTNFKSTVKNVNLYNLGFSKDPMARLTTNVSIDLLANSLDDLLGQVILENTLYQTSTQSLAFDKMFINSSIDDKGKRLVNFRSEEIINGYLEGQFKLSQVLEVAENAFGKLLANYETKPIDEGQYFDFKFDIKDYFFEVLFPSITLKPGTKLDGEITIDNHLILKAKTPGLIYDKYEFGESQVTLNTKNPFFQTSLISDNVNLNGYKLDDVRILTINNNDTVEIKTKFTGNFGGVSKQDFGLNLYKTKNEEGKDLVGFLKSTIHYNDNEWVLNPRNEKNSHFAYVDFEQNQYFINKIVLESGLQKLELNGSYLNDFLKLDFKVQNTELEALLPSFKNVRLEGLANGKVDVEYGDGVFQPIADLEVKDFTWNDYTFGDVLVNVQMEKGLYKVDSKIHKGVLDQLAVVGYINPNSKDDYLDLKVNFDEFEIEILNAFMEGIAEDIRGDITGQIDLRGSIDKPGYQGSINLNNSGVKITYLGTDYDIVGSPEVLISTGLIYFFDRIELKDTEYNTEGYLTGDISHEDFLSWNLNLDLFANNFIVMNTSYENNPLFYGKVYANELYSTVKGPVNDLDISIIATTAPGTSLTINTGGQGLEVSDEVTFVNIVDRNISEKESKISDEYYNSGMDLGMNIKITPDAGLDLILDEKNDDKIVASGKGDIRLNLDLDGNMTMNGEVEITDGYYNFSRGAIKKIFNLRPYSTISWIGDVYNAQLDVKAYFERSVSNVGEYISSYAQSLQTEVEVALTGALSSPDIEFNVLTPDAPESVKSNLALKFSDKDEEIRQWGGVLLFGKFLPPDNTNYMSGLTTTAYELAFGQLSSLLSNISRYVTLNLGYTEGSDEYNTSDIVNVKGKVDLNPRVSVNVSGGIAVNSNNNTSDDDVNSQSLTGSVEIEYDISKNNDGSLNLKAFSRPTSFGVDNFNASNTNNYSQAWGGGVYYHQDFNTLKEFKSKVKDLFKGKNRKEKQAEEEKNRVEGLNKELTEGNSLFDVTPKVDSLK